MAPFGLDPYLKFIAPVLLALVGAVVTGLVTETWDLLEMEILVVGFLSSTVTFIATTNTLKALAPAVLTLVGIGVHYAFTGEWNDTETAAALVGLLSAFVAAIVPNSPATARRL